MAKKWISRDDRLPKAYEDVLITDGVLVYVGCYSEVSGLFHLVDADQIVLRTTHWRPLPKLPK